MQCGFDHRVACTAAPDLGNRGLSAMVCMAAAYISSLAPQIDNPAPATSSPRASINQRI